MSDEPSARDELEDLLRRRAADLLDRDDAPLVTGWTLVLSIIPGDGDGDDAEVEVLTRAGALFGHVLGDLRIATLATEAGLRETWE